MEMPSDTSSASVECSSWKVLGSHSAERNLLEKDAWCFLVRLRFQHWSNTEASLTPTEASVGNAKCLELNTEQDYFCGCGCGGRCTLDATVDIFMLEHEVLSGGVVAIGAARQGAVAGHRHCAGSSWSQGGGFGVPRVAAPSLFVFKGWASKEICWRCKANCSFMHWTDTSTAAARRTSRYRTSELLARQTEQGISVDPLSLPGCSVEFICTDVLHSMDLGTTWDMIGN